jgi:hypothetical protein
MSLWTRSVNVKDFKIYGSILPWLKDNSSLEVYPSKIIILWTEDTSKRAGVWIEVVLDGLIDPEELVRDNHLYKLIAIGCGTRRSVRIGHDFEDSESRFDNEIGREERKQNGQNKDGKREDIERGRVEFGEVATLEVENDAKGIDEGKSEVNGSGNRQSSQAKVTDFVIMLVKQCGNHYERRGMAVVDARSWLSDGLRGEMEWTLLQ